ncbi:hypothetical protein [Bacillus sp. FJAT-47783]|uniref:hypothetical protein n=1 Tax=Bacillus sp. FJAT-47783 TaxID=2922712 RepID=UPI001FAE409B|nr:hypothetical protein [Bacillus sp. FJAT-47783]
MSDVLNQYKTYRTSGMFLNDRMLKSLNKEKFIRLSNLFKTVAPVYGGDQLIPLLDTAINEPVIDEISIARRFFEEERYENEMEKKILEGLLQSYPSLYQVKNVSQVENKIYVEDILQNKGEELNFIDSGFSETIKPGLLLFTRIIRLEEFNISSGFSFVFHPNIQHYLFNRLKKLQKKVPHELESVKRIVAFYAFNQKDGINVYYDTVEL